MTKVVLDLDNSDFTAKMKESLGLIDGLGEVEGLAKLGEQIVNIGVVLAPIVVAILAVKAALDLTKEGEHVEQVNNTFKMMATNAGLAADVIKDQLIKAAGGMAGETEILQAGSKAIMEMGENAKHVPEIMELARKYTAAFGGDLVDNFSRMSMAMENGNTKMLRNFRITVDATKAHQDFAEKIGTSVEFLSQAGQKQAIFNVALERAHKNLDGVDTSSLQVTSNTAKMVTAFKELYEAVAQAFTQLEKKFGIFSTVINEITKDTTYWTHAIKSALGIADTASESHQENLKKEVALTQQTTAETAKSNEKYKDRQKITQAETKFHGELLKIKEAAEKDAEKVDTDYQQFVKLRADQKVSIEKDAQQKIHELEVNAHAKHLISDQEMANATVQINKKKDEDIRALENKSYSDRVTALKNLQAQNQYTAAGFATAWKEKGAEATQSLHSFGQMGQTSFQAVQSHASTAFKAIGDGSQSAGQALRGAMFGAIGDMATAQGEYFLAAGLGSVAGGDAGGAIQIAEGGALIALGSALAAMGSGSKGVPSSSGGGGGSSAAATAPASQPAAAPTPQAQQQKSLTVAINGNIFDTDQTRTRLMDMIRQSGDFTDFNLLKIGQSS